MSRRRQHGFIQSHGGFWKVKKPFGGLHRMSRRATLFAVRALLVVFAVISFAIVKQTGDTVFAFIGVGLTSIFLWEFFVRKRRH